MEVKHNISLKNKTTIKIGGIAHNFYIPSSAEELLELVKKINTDKFYIISGGSNLLINDKKEFENVISMENVDNTIECLGDNNFYIGASNRIQNVINHVNNMGFGGIEEFYSLPAMFGGMIYMNAGIGSKNSSSVVMSNILERVKVINLKEQKIEWLNNSECGFNHRTSLFQNDKYIILGAECKFDYQDINESKKRISERMTKCKEKQEWGKGCFGTCFSVADRKLLKLISLLNFNKSKIYQSKTNSNWLVNRGTATYDDAMKIINKAKKIHRIFHKKIKCEVVIWG